jgi:hypothetical protein
VADHIDLPAFRAARMRESTAMARPQVASRVAAVIVAVCTAGFTAVSCGSDDALPTEGAYCTQVGDHLAALNAPALALPADIDVMVKEWKAVADSAPVAVAQEWDVMMAALETAVTVDPNDNSSLQTLADTARTSEQAANRVITYTYEKCGATIGGIAPVPATAAPTDSTPVSTAPVDAASTTAAP